MPKGGGGSNSESNTSTSSNSEDNKVSATDNAIALGKDSQFSYVEEFPDNVKAAFTELIDLAKDAGLTAIGFANEAIKANSDSLQLVATRAKQAEDAENLKEGVLVKDIFPMLVVGVLGFGAIFAYKSMKVKK